MVPGNYDRPTGCLLNPRCPYATDSCRSEEPELGTFPTAVSLQMSHPLDDAGEADTMSTQESTLPRPLLQAIDLKKHYPVNKGLFAPERLVKALDGVSFTLSAAKRWR